MKSTFTAVAASLALVATSAAAQQAQGTTGTKKSLEHVNPDAVFASWDTDHDDRLSKQEFTTGLRGQSGFQHADTDNDGRISKAEFKTQLKAMNVYQKADLNNNGSVEPQEVERLLGEDRAAKWNQRQPASLSEDELYEGVYSAWSSNASAGLTQEEMLAGIFRFADRDNDGSIAKTEFARNIARAKGDSAAAPTMKDRSRTNEKAGTPQQSGINTDRMPSNQSDRGQRAGEAVGTSGILAGATVGNIVDNPNAYIGRTVAVSGDVGDVFGPRVFNLEEQGVIDVDDELIVVAPENAARVTEDSHVQARGTVRRIVTTDLEAAYGPAYWTHWGVDRDFFVTRESRPVLFADTIDVTR
jgi:Ca2+-binding EF-hand superfamily protein